MKFIEGLRIARGQIIFIVGFIAGLILIYNIEKRIPQKKTVAAFEIEKTADIKAVKTDSLSKEEKEFAKIAWQYFVNNFNANTGLVNSVDAYPSTTMWDTGSYLLAVISAQRLGIIDSTEFNKRITLALNSLAKIPLFDNLLPNKAYNATNLEMVNYQNEKNDRGIGWSAIDIGRLFVPFNILVWNYPQHSVAVQKVISRFKMDKLFADGYLQGALVDKTGKTSFVQEGRVGYEQYAAKTFTLMGKNAINATKYENNLNLFAVNKVKIPTDIRTPQKMNAHNYVVSENYILDGLEFGFDEHSKELAYRVYKVQEERYKSTGILTAVSEDNLDQAPYFVYNTVFTDGKLWNCITEDGKDAENFKSLSSKAVFGWNYLYSTPYTQTLMNKIKPLYDAKKGWYAGVYEKQNTPNKAITCNTNAIILEALCYKQFGKLLNL